MGNRDEELVEERPLTPNRNGANLFLGPQFLGQWVCPLHPGEDCITRIIPHVGVLVLPIEPDYPIEISIREPNSQPTNTTTQHDK